MGLLDLLDHLLNFAAPALVVGILLAILAPIFIRKGAAGHTVFVQAAINSIAGVVALGAGLWFFGRDGKMASYAAMVLVCASSQWWATRR